MTPPSPPGGTSDMLVPEIIISGSSYGSKVNSTPFVKKSRDKRVITFYFRLLIFVWK